MIAVVLTVNLYTEEYSMKRERIQVGRRAFLRSTAAGALGAGLAWRFGGTWAWGQIPWESKPDTVLLSETSSPAVSPKYLLGRGIKNEYPRIAFDADERLWAAWVSERSDGEQIYLTSFAGERWGDEMRVSDSEGLATHPEILALGDALSVVWAEERSEGWKLFLRAFRGGRPGPIREIACEGSIHWRPALASDAEGRLWVVWERKLGKAYEIMAAVASGAIAIEVRAMALAIVVAALMLVLAAAGASAKSGRTWYTEERLGWMADNVARYEWAQSERDRIIARADSWAKYDDETLVRLVPPLEVPRCGTVHSSGCPVHGDALMQHSGGLKSWRMSFDQPYKITCPVGGESYPSNDFWAYLQTGDEALLTGDYVDDGWGCQVEGHEKKFWFVGFYAGEMTRRWLLPAINDLSRAYLLTGDATYAHKCALLLHRLAQYYPDYFYETQSRYGLEFMPWYLGRLQYHTWECFTIQDVTLAYDAVWPAIADDAELQAATGQSADEIRAYIEDRILRVAATDVIDGSHRIQGNYGMHQSALLRCALVLDSDQGSPSRQDMLDWLLTGVVMDKRGAPVTASGLNLDITRAGDIIPLSWDKRTIREVALVSHDAQHVTVREHRVEDGRRVIVNRRFDVQGTAIAKEWPPEQLIGAGITPKLKLDLPYSEYPTFALAMPAIANNIDPDSPFTVSVLHAARDAIGVADDYFDNLGNDVELGRKMMLISEMLLRRDDDGNAIPPSRDRQSFFLMLPGSVDTEDPPLKEYNPDLRVDENERGINLALSLVSKAVGMGYGRYRMEGGALKTATEVISQNSDLYRTRKKHFRAFAASIETLARAALVLGREVMGVPVDPCIQIRVTSDDSVIEDDAAKRERARDAVNAGLMSKLRYLVEIEGLTEEAARVELEELSKDAPSFSLLD